MKYRVLIFFQVIIFLILFNIVVKIDTRTENFAYTESDNKKKKNKKRNRKGKNHYPKYYTYGSYPYPVIRDRDYPNPYYVADPYYYLMNRYDDDITFYRDTYNSTPFSYANYRSVEPEYCWKKISGESPQQLVNLAKQFGVQAIQIPRYNSNHILVPSTTDCYIDKFGDKSMYDMYMI